MHAQQSCWPAADIYAVPCALQVCAIADRAHGFVGADLASLCGEAALNALRRLVENASDGLNSMVSMADFQAACAVVRPSALREVALEIPDVRWSDIGGLEDVKTRLREVVELPFQRDADLKHLSVKAPQGSHRMLPRHDKLCLGWKGAPHG